MIAQYKTGTPSVSTSKDAFCVGIDYVFPEQFSEDKQKKIYSSIRCGMYHNAFIKKDVLISADYPESIAAEDDGKGHTLIKVNPHRQSTELNVHFHKYIAELKDPNNTKLRTNFETIFNS